MLQQFDERNRDLVVNIDGRLSHRDEGRQQGGLDEARSILVKQLKLRFGDQAAQYRPVIENQTILLLNLSPITGSGIQRACGHSPRTRRSFPCWSLP